MHQLMFRVYPENGESLESFLVRTAWRNRYSVSDFRSYLKSVLPTYSYPFLNVNLSALAKITGTDKEILYSCSWQSLLQDNYPLKRAGRDSLENIHIKQRLLEPIPHTDSRYCPHCLEESGYHRLIWIPRLVTTCLRHKCFLQRKCWNCSKCLDVEDILNGKCRFCEYNLAFKGINNIRCDKRHLKTQTILQSWLLGKGPPNDYLARHLGYEISYWIIHSVYIKVYRSCSHEHDDVKAVLTSNKSLAETIRLSDGVAKAVVRAEKLPKEWLFILEEQATSVFLDIENQKYEFIESTLLPAIICLRPWKKAITLKVISHLLGLSSELTALLHINGYISLEYAYIRTIVVVSRRSLYEIWRRHTLPISTLAIASYFRISASAANALGQICILLSHHFRVSSNKDELTLQLILHVLDEIYKSWYALKCDQPLAWIAGERLWNKYSGDDIEFMVSMLNAEVLEDLSSVNLDLDGLYLYFRSQFLAVIEGYTLGAKHS